MAEAQLGMTRPSSPSMSSITNHFTENHRCPRRQFQNSTALPPRNGLLSQRLHDSAPLAPPAPLGRCHKVLNWLTYLSDFRGSNRCSQSANLDPAPTPADRGN